MTCKLLLSQYENDELSRHKGAAISDIRKQSLGSGDLGRAAGISDSFQHVEVQGVIHSTKLLTTLLPNIPQYQKPS